jgi:asparagine synthase (glutamine-hydrolysing)
VKNSKIEEVIYYDIDNEGKEPISLADSYTVLENALQKSVQSQMISDVKLGCQLSGGVDSSLVTYYAAKNIVKGNLETISITLKDPKFSEEKYVDIVASKLDLKAHKFEMDEAYYFEAIEKAIWHFEHPLNHPNTIGIYLLSQEAKKKVTVLLRGEGADEALAGYRRFLDAKEGKTFTRSFFGGLKRNISHVSCYLSYALNSEKRMIMATAFGSIATAKALRPDFRINRAISRRSITLNNLKGELNLRQRKYELLTYLPDLLMRQDKMSMAHSIENRVPFLDNKMVSISFNMREEALIRNHKDKLESKKVLKDIAAEKFGESFAFRDKMGFPIPLRAFMASTVFQEKWKQTILPSIKKRGVFKVKEVSKWVNNIEEASPDQLDAIWLLFGLEIWAKQYLDK